MKLEKEGLLIIISILLLYVISFLAFVNLYLPREVITPRLGPPAYCERYSCSDWADVDCGINNCGPQDIYQERICEAPTKDSEQEIYGEETGEIEGIPKKSPIPQECISRCFPNPGICNLPPDIPFNPNPADLSVDIDINSDLSWEGNDQNNDILTYDLYFGTNSNPSLLASDLTSENYDLNTLDYETDYYWKIVSKDPYDQTMGPEWKFTTISDNPQNEPPDDDSDSDDNGGSTTSTTVEDNVLFDIKVFIDDDSLEVISGDKVKSSVVLFNFGTLRPVDVELECTIEDFEKNKLNQFKETLAVDLQTSIIRELKTPADIPPGRYVYTCYLTYQQETILSSALFEVLEQKTPELEMPLSLPSIILLLFLTSIIIIAAIISIIKLKVRGNIRENGKRKSGNTKTTSREHKKNNRRN